MSDYYTEQLIKKQTTMKDVFLKALLVSVSIVSVLVIRCTSGKENGASRTAAVIKMLIAVSLGACLNTLYCRRAIWLGFSSSSASNRRSNGD